MIENNLKKLNENIRNTAHSCGRNPDDIKVVAVSKRFPARAILEAFHAGHMLFGENYLQEAAEKKRILGDKIKIHFIGHLQSNKAKVAADIFDVIETIDRIKIAKALDRHLVQMNRRLDILVQVNIGYDTNKSGVLPEDTGNLLSALKSIPSLRPLGLMTMPPYTEDQQITRRHFKALRSLAEELQNKELLPSDRIELSMGMSGDYPIAIEEGATLIRVGTAIFGQRPPK